MSFPRVFIYGQPFNNFTGGGITLSNLFKGWPKSNIAVAYTGHGLYNITSDICDIYYQLGTDENKWIFPFNLIQRKFPSGLKKIEVKTNTDLNQGRTGLRYILVNKYFYPFLSWLGLFHCVSKITLSNKLKKWLSEFQPEILYLQASTRDGILFSRELCEYLKIPVVIHIMDDWPSTISNRGLFKDFWHKKIDREFKQLLKGINLHLSISDAMSEEYNRRYQLKFIAFHNPIEIKSWLKYIKTDFTIDKNHISVLYSGRLGDLGISNSLVEIASAIDSMEKNEYNIKLHIQTPTDKQSILNQLRKFKCVVVNPFVEYSEIPRVFSSVDILLLANDFSKQGIDYLRFSMPTKASEYMISGTPIMVYSAEETAVSKFFTRNDCGYCVTRQGSEEIIKALRYLIINEEYRRRISRNAVQLAKDRFDSGKVRSEFQNLLINLYKKDNYVH